jgi:hypothetical protein
MGPTGLRPARHIDSASVAPGPGAPAQGSSPAPAAAGARVLYARNAGAGLGGAELAKLPEHRKAALQVLQERFRPARGIRTLSELLSPQPAQAPAADFGAHGGRL